MDTERVHFWMLQLQEKDSTNKLNSISLALASLLGPSLTNALTQTSLCVLDYI